MIQNVFSIYDTKASAYLTPFFLPTVPMALRVFAECANSSDHQFGRHPEDFTLFHLGTFDDETCIFTALETKAALGVAIEFVNVALGDGPNGAGQAQGDGDIPPLPLE